MPSQIKEHKPIFYSDGVTFPDIKRILEDDNNIGRQLTLLRDLRILFEIVRDDVSIIPDYKELIQYLKDNAFTSEEEEVQAAYIKALSSTDAVNR
jgi:hypothetical protein